MKKLFLMLAAATFAANVSAQNTAITSNKFGDNWYLGIKGGAATPMQKWGDYGFTKGFAPNAGIRLGKNLTTVFGLAVDADAYLMSKSDSKSMMANKTIVNATNVSLLWILLSIWVLPRLFSSILSLLSSSVCRTMVMV